MPGDVVEAGLQSGSWASLQERRAKARPLQKSKDEGKGKDDNTEGTEKSGACRTPKKQKAPTGVGA